MLSFGVFDSNVWALGFTGRNSECENLIQDVRDGNRLTLISPYIYREVDNIFDGISDPRRRSQTKQNFANFVFDCEAIAIAHPDRVESTTVQEERNRPEMGLISQLSGCEKDDAPILLSAWELLNNPSPLAATVSIHTTDKHFADAVDNCDRLPNISSHYIST